MVLNSHKIDKLNIKEKDFIASLICCIESDTGDSWYDGMLNTIKRKL